MLGQLNYKCDSRVSPISLWSYRPVQWVVYCCMGFWFWLLWLGLYGLGLQSH